MSTLGPRIDPDLAAIDARLHEGSYLYISSRVGDPLRGVSLDGSGDVEALLAARAFAGSPHRCPVCDGRGSVPAGFYATTGNSLDNSTADVECRSCRGSGVLWR